MPTSFDFWCGVAVGAAGMGALVIVVLAFC
jgi:hypothetical protein